MNSAEHKTEAFDLLDRARTAHDSGAANTVATAALAHATLALVEQQRIANLIAYTEALAENERDGYVLNEAGMARRDLMEVQIVDGLGL